MRFAKRGRLAALTGSELTMPDQAQFNANGAMAVSDRAYVVRQFERDTLKQLSASQWVSLLGPRKYGKSSALMRIQSHLKKGGYSCAFIDLQGFYAEPGQKYSQFLEWFADKLATEIGGEFNRPPERQREMLDSWLAAVATPEFRNVAILIDEASGVPDRFRVAFFSQLRAIFNSRNRTDSSMSEVAARLVFAFAGTFRPSRMIDNHNSPFNVSLEINPDDLTRGEVDELAALGLNEDASPFAERAFTETRGQPYYVQHLFAAVQNADGDLAARTVAFDRALEELRVGAHGHLEDFTRYADEDHELRDLIPRILDDNLPFQAGNPVHNYALITGIARNNNGRLVPRNPIYASALARFREEGYP